MSLPELKTTSYQFLRKFIADQSGIELGPDRQYLVESRLEPILQDLGCPSLADLCRAIEGERVLANSPRPISRKIIHALSTHETSFFRDPDFFRVLGQTILPNLLSTNCTGRLRIWSAAASSGQEAYSIAILAAETGIQPQPLIIATDISAIVLEIAAEAVFSDYELLRGFEDSVLRKKYLLPRKGGAQLIPQIRQSIEFHCCDLRDTNRSFAPLDLILCRNVLIYFDEPTRSRVLQHLLTQLRPGGILVLGAAEAIFNDFDALTRISTDSFTYYQKVIS